VKIDAKVLVAVVLVVAIVAWWEGWIPGPRGSSRVSFELITSDGGSVPVEPNKTMQLAIITDGSSGSSGSKVIKYGNQVVTGVRAVLYLTANVSGFSPSVVDVSYTASGSVGGKQIASFSANTSLTPNMETRISNSAIEVTASAMSYYNFAYGNYTLSVSYSGTGTAEGVSGSFSTSGSISFSYTEKTLSITASTSTGSFSLVK